MKSFLGPHLRQRRLPRRARLRRGQVQADQGAGADRQDDVPDRHGGRRRDRDGADRRPSRRRRRSALDKAKAAKTPPPAPKFSARAEAGRGGAAAGQRATSSPGRSSTGCGTASSAPGWSTPLDQMHSENPPSHPELLDWLARDTAEHGYDLRRLIRGIVLSQAYSREQPVRLDEPPPTPKLFAVARLKPLTPLQLATSLQDRRDRPGDVRRPKPDEFEKRIEQMESSARGFASLIAQPTDDFQIGVGEALLFSNGDRVHEGVPDRRRRHRCSAG